MRNLKRALSLALASVMLMGMMVVGSSAASYPDVDDQNHVEAIEVLSAVGVIVGDNGNFRPDDSVSRNEMAVIMAKLILGTYEADSYVGSHPFTDVPDWASRYVAACYNSGIIAGRSETTYDGTATVTAVEAAAMMLRALGYQDLSKGASQWDQPVAAKANEINLFKGLGGNSQTPMDRDSVAQLALNTLQADVVITEKEGDIEIPGTIVIPGKITYKAVQSSDPYASAIDGIYGTDNNNNVQLGEKLYKGDLEKKTNSNDDFERPATEWTYKGREVIKAVNSADATYTKAVKLGDIYKDLGLGKAVDKDSVDFYLNGKPESETKGGKIIANNKVGSEAAAPTLDTLNLVKGEEHKIGGNGVLTQVWYNAKTNTATITMIETYVGKVNTVVKATGSAARYVKVGSTTSYGSLTTLNNKFETESFETDDLVIFTAAYNGSKYDIKSMEALELSATEVLTRWEGSSVVNSDKGNANSNFTAGETYDYSKNNLVVDEDGAVLANGIADFKVNESEVNVYVDKYGYAIYVSGVEGEKNYAAVIGMGSSNTHGSETRGVTLLLADGTQKAVTAKMDDWSVMTRSTQSGAYPGIGTGTSDRNLVEDGIADLVTYSVGSDGVYKLTLVGEKTLVSSDGNTANNKIVYSGKYDTAADSKSGTGNVSFVNGKSEMKLTSNYDGANNTGTVTAGSKTYYTTSKTIFMVATQKKTANMVADAYNGRNYNVYVGYENAPSFITTSDAIHGMAFATNKQYTNQIDVVYIDAYKMAGVSGADTYFVKDGSDIITTSDGKYYELPAVIDGELTTILIDAEVKASWNGTPDTKLENAEKGVYAIENIIKNNKDIIESCDLVAFNVNGTGTVRDRDTVLGIGNSITSAAYWAYNSDTKVYYVDSDWNLSEVGMSGIQTDGNDKVFAMHDGGTPNKKLTYVFVREIEDEGAVEPPKVDAGKYSINLDKDGDGTNKVDVLVAASATAAEKTDSAIIDQVVAKIEKDFPGTKVGKVAFDETNSVWVFTCKRGVVESEYKWDPSNKADNAISINLNGTPTLISGSSTIATLVTDYPGTAVRVSGSSTLANNGFKTTGALEAGVSYETGYVKVTVAVTGSQSAAWSVKVASTSDTTGVTVTKDTTPDPDFYAKLADTITVTVSGVKANIAITGATTNAAAADVAVGGSVTDTVNSTPADITVTVKD